MNIDTMRKIDHYVGVPLCFLGTVMVRLCRLFFRRDQSGRPKNILFIELSEMGSTILADPAMQKLKRSLNADLFFAIFERNRQSLDLLGTVAAGDIFVISDASMAGIAVGAVRFFFWARKKRIDTVIDLELFSRFTALLTGFSGAERTVGFHAFYNEGLYRGDFLTHKVAYNPHQHIAKNFVALVNALLSDKVEIPYSKTLIVDEEITPRKVAVSEDSKEVMRRRIKEAYPALDERIHKVVLFNTDASELIPLRRWPREYYIGLAGMILDRYPDIIILLTGNQTERAGKEGIIAAVRNGRCVNFAGLTSIHDLPALYSVSSFMLTNDSGPAHIASVSEMPVFVLFGPETPRAYGPLGTMTPIYAGLACSPCVSAVNHKKSACNDNVCLQVITPEKVFHALQPSLELFCHAEGSRAADV